MHAIMVSSDGLGLSIPSYTVYPQEVFQEAQRNHHMHRFGTNFEGEWDAVSC